MGSLEFLLGNAGSRRSPAPCAMNAMNVSNSCGVKQSWAMGSRRKAFLPLFIEKAKRSTGGPTVDMCGWMHWWALLPWDLAQPCVIACMLVYFPSMCLGTGQ